MAAKITKNLDSPARFAYQDTMIRRCLQWLALALVLGVTLALMWGPMRNETTTGDETVFLGAGYSYWLGHRYYLNIEHPPLMQLWSAFPLLFLDVKQPKDAERLFDGTFYWPVPIGWDNRERWGETFDPARQPFYHYAVVEGTTYGHTLVYGGENDADKLLFWGRFMQALVTLATGLLVFLWARSLSNVAGGLLALAAWCFNPLALAYGHLIITDPGIALMLPLAVWMFSRFLESPRPRTTLVVGLAFGAALLTKYTAIILIPIFGALAAVAWWRQRRSPGETSARNLLGSLFLIVAVAWGMVLLMYFPHWSPPPPISNADAQVLRIPTWFTRLRWLWIPRDYFKGLTIMLLHVSNGSRGYLLGQWSDKGWSYFYPVAMLIKTPVSLLLLLTLAIVVALRRIRRASLAEAAPLIAAAVYLACAMTNKADIGVRHVLPIYPLLAVVAGIEFARAKPRDQLVGWVLCAWLVVTAFLAHTDYIAYFNELVGGPANGGAYLIGPDFDWGQDGKQLKTWVKNNHISNPYLEFSGPHLTIEYLRIPHRQVQAAQVRELHDGLFVISASSLMSTNYDWLRASSAPVRRIGYTFFVYSLAAASNQPPIQ